MITPQMVANFKFIDPIDALRRYATVSDKLPGGLQNHRPEAVPLGRIAPAVPGNPLLHPGAVEERRVITHCLSVAEDECESIGILGNEFSEA
jgi:hypothetical protein